MLSFCLVSSSTSRWAAAQRRSASALTSVSSLVGLGLGLTDDLVGVRLSVGDQLPGVLAKLVTVIASYHRHVLTRRGLFEEVGQPRLADSMRAYRCPPTLKMNTKASFTVNT